MSQTTETTTGSSSSERRQGDQPASAARKLNLLVVDDDIRAQVHGQAPEADIRAAALAKGMQLMRDDGERLIAAGITSREEVVRVTRD